MHLMAAETFRIVVVHPDREALVEIVKELPGETVLAIRTPPAHMLMVDPNDRDAVEQALDRAKNIDPEFDWWPAENEL